MKSIIIHIAIFCTISFSGFAQCTSGVSWCTVAIPIGGTDVLGGDNSTTNPLNFQTNGATRVTILGATNPGFVGIGTTGPGNLLHMNKTGATDELYLQWTNGNTTSTLGMIMGVNTSNQGVINMKEQKPLRFYTDNIFRMEITGGGKVGIGTDAAQNLVHQHNSTNNSSTYHQFTTSSTGGTGSGNPTDGLTVGLTYDAAGTNAEFNLQENTGNMNFLTNAEQRMTILSGGKIGIGTASPGTPLHVLSTTTPAYSIKAETNTGATGAGDLGGLYAKCVVTRANGTDFNRGVLVEASGSSYYNIGVDATVTPW